MNHPHGIHCIHIFGWRTAKWCSGCSQCLHQFHGWEDDPPIGHNPSPEELASWRRAFEIYIDAMLARIVLAEIEREELPCPPTFGHLFPEVPTPSQLAVPSDN